VEDDVPAGRESRHGAGLSPRVHERVGELPARLDEEGPCPRRRITYAQVQDLLRGRPSARLREEWAEGCLDDGLCQPSRSLERHSARAAEVQGAVVRALDRHFAQDREGAGDLLDLDRPVR
jgi:hypothetical protein